MLGVQYVTGQGATLQGVSVPLLRCLNHTQARQERRPAGVIFLLQGALPGRPGRQAGRAAPAGAWQLGALFALGSPEAWAVPRGIIERPPLPRVQ